MSVSIIQTLTQRRRYKVARYKVSFEIEVNEGNPLDWLPDTVGLGLEEGETANNWYIEELEEKQDDNAA